MGQQYDGISSLGLLNMLDQPLQVLFLDAKAPIGHKTFRVGYRSVRVGLTDNGDTGLVDGFDLVGLKNRVGFAITRPLGFFTEGDVLRQPIAFELFYVCLLYTSDAADE